MRRILAIATCAVASAGVFADMTIGADESTNVVVAAGETDALEGNLRAAVGAGAIDKTGGGTWSASLGGLWTRDSLAVNVREGTFSASATGAVPSATPATPPAAMEKAALWLDASKNAEAWSEDAGRVKTWYDARETNEGGTWGNTYFRASARPARDNTSGAADAITNFPEVVSVAAASGSLPMMYFRGMQSGSWMRYVDNNGTDGAVKGIRHAFVAIKIDTAYGYVFGDWNTGVFMHPGYINTAAAGAYANASAGTPAFPNGRFYRNGEPLDPVETVSKALQVLEIVSGVPYGNVGTIFCDRNQKGRYGGDYIGELVLFTNKLTEAERFDVSEYLLRKWVSEPLASPPMAVALAEDAAFEPAADLMGQLTLSGLGLLCLESGSSYYSRATDGFNGTMRLSGGSATTIGIGELPFAFRPGDRLATSRGSFDVLTATHTSDASDAAAGIARHTGAGTLRVKSLAGVTAFSTEADEFVLSAPMRKLGTITTNVYATIAGGNADFEAFTRANASVTQGAASGARTERGWTLEPRMRAKPDGSGDATGYVYILNAKTALDAATSGNSWLFGFNNATSLATHDIRKFYPPDNGTVAIVKVAGALSADVAVPESGDYEFSFALEARLAYETGLITLSLVDESVTPAVTNTFARFRQPRSYGTSGWTNNYWLYGVDGWHTYRFLLRNIAVGAYRLVIDAEGGRFDADCCAILDNFCMKLVESGDAHAERAEPPNGSFEVTDSPFDMCTVYSPSNTVQNWTLVQNVGTMTIATNCEVCFSARWHGETGRWFAEQTRYGESQLLLREAGGYAESAAFTLPAGTWKLHFRGTRFAFDGASYGWYGHTTGKDATVAASVLVNGVEKSLGTSATMPKYIFAMSEYVLPTAFTVTAGDSVVLRLRQGTASDASATACAAVDDVWFERTDGFYDKQELVKEGNFPAVSYVNWTTAQNKDEDNSKSDVYIRQSGNSANYGYTLGDGPNSLLIVQTGQATQPITFSEAGMYRLSFWTRSRYSTDANNGTISTFYGGNQVRAWLRDPNSETQEIYRTMSVYSTNFYEHVALFRVDAPGTYTLGLQGCNHYPDAITTSSSINGQKDSNVFVDAVSIRKVDAAEMPALDKDLQLTLGATSRLRLDFDGTATIKGLRLGGRKTIGVIDANHASGLVSGPGSLFVPPVGSTIIFR